MSIFIKRLSNCIEVLVERKKIKNIRLRVLPDGIVKLSVPLGVAEPWIDDYLQKSFSWIEKSLAYFKDREDHRAETVIENGTHVYILGRQLIVKVELANIYHIEQSEDSVYIKSPVIDSPQALQKQYERWLHTQSKNYFITVIDKWYPVIAPHGFEKPRLQVRKMKTRWGSCSPAHKKINLNLNLYKARPDCVEYVVLHELGHFLHPRHDKAFYDFLTLHMPDWQERKKILNYGIATV